MEPTAPPVEQPVVAWYRQVLSTSAGAGFDDFLVLLPEGIGAVGLTGEDTTVEADIEALRDKEEPANKAT